MRPRSVINKGIQYKITAMGRIFTLGERYIAAIYNPKDTSLKITAEAICVADEEERNTIPFTFSKYDTDRLKAGWATIEIYDSNMTQMAFRDNFAVIRPNSIKISGPTTYTIQFFGSDEVNPLQVLQVTEGTVPVYTGPTPTKPDARVAEDAIIIYTFAGWSPSVHAATDNADYIAVFSEERESLLSATFVNYNGSILQYPQYLRYGDTPVYTGETPTRPDTSSTSSGGSHFTFSGWSPEIGPLTTNTLYVAQYEEEVYEYLKRLDLSSDGDRYGRHRIRNFEDMSVFYVGQKFRLVPIDGAVGDIVYGHILEVDAQDSIILTDVDLYTMVQSEQTNAFDIDIIVEESESV